MAKSIVMIGWDEIDGEAHVSSSDDVENADKLPGHDCTDEELISLARKLNGDTKDTGWRVASIARGKRTATIEWRSDRNHLATSQIIWC